MQILCLFFFSLNLPHLNYVSRHRTCTKIFHHLMPEPSNVDQATQAVEGLSLEKKPKVRKAQTEQEFNLQKHQFQASGPRINTSDWLYDSEVLEKLDSTKKVDRVHILHACEKAYFCRDYAKCLELILVAEKLFGVELEDDNANDNLKEEFANLGRKTKKSSKVERHVVELLHIKEACLRRMAQI